MDDEEDIDKGTLREVVLVERVLLVRALLVVVEVVEAIDV